MKLNKRKKKKKKEIKYFEGPEYADLFTHKAITTQEFPCHALARYSVIDKYHPDIKPFLESLLNGQFVSTNEDKKLDKCLACVLGNVIGDSLGAPLEFSKLRYNTNELTGFDPQIWDHPQYNGFRLKMGQYTDDASMMLCLAESLLACQGFNPLDLRVRFFAWNYFGYCNAFGYDSPPRSSVGLGGNISLSMSEFRRIPVPTEYTKAGDSNTSGNGSIMRNAPIPVYFAKSENIEEAEKIASKQSLTTHQGVEAAECCRLLTHICMKAILGESKESILSNLSKTFQSTVYSVQCLAGSLQEERNENNSNQNLEDRNWNWKDPEFKYSPTRSERQPGYIGSYAMDNLAMSLHCVWTTETFSEALLKCANMCGDADSVCAVVGQIAGSLYGFNSIPQDWLQAILTWDPYGLIPYRAKILYQFGHGVEENKIKI